MKIITAWVEEGKDWGMLVGKSFTFETQLCSSSNRGGNLLLWHEIGCFDSQVNNLSKELHSSLICKHSIQLHFIMQLYYNITFKSIHFEYFLVKCLYIICDKIEGED